MSKTKKLKEPARCCHPTSTILEAYPIFRSTITSTLCAFRTHAIALVVLITCLVALLTPVAPAWGDDPQVTTERITNFSTVIQVEKSGLLRVTENITVIAAGRKIIRGIYRDFPTSYESSTGTKHVTFNVISTKRNGQTTPHSIKTDTAGVRVFIGESTRKLKPGEHTYSLTYVTNFHIRNHWSLDELYWNVTGNGWEFPIDKADATVILPIGTRIFKRAVYTGIKGSKSSHATIRVLSEWKLKFTTTKPLKPSEGLTIALSWQKGIVKEYAPLTAENTQLIAPEIGVAALLLYCFVILYRLRPSKKAGPITPRTMPPDGICPAAARQLRREFGGKEKFISALLSMRAKNYLSIEMKKEDEIWELPTIERYPDADAETLSACEKALADTLFISSERIQINSTNAKTIFRSEKAFLSALKSEIQAKYIQDTGRLLLPALMMALITVVPLCVASLIFLVRLIGLPLAVLNLILLSRKSLVSDWIPRRVLFAFWLTTRIILVPFFLFGVIRFLTLTTWSDVLALLVPLIVAFYWYHLRTPTPRGRTVLDELEGFKLYLMMSPDERAKLKDAPEETPELIDKLAPWAYALNVEQEWKEGFAVAIENALQATNGRKRYYHDSDGHLDPLSLATLIYVSLHSS
jgi:hypothetical protein